MDKLVDLLKGVFDGSPMSMIILGVIVIFFMRSNGGGGLADSLLEIFLRPR